MTRHPFDPAELGDDDPALQRVAERLESYAASFDGEPSPAMVGRILAAAESETPRGGVAAILVALRRPARALASPTPSVTPTASPSASPTPTAPPSPTPTVSPTSEPTPTTVATSPPSPAATPVPTASADDDEIETPEPSESDDDHSGPGGGGDD